MAALSWTELVKQERRLVPQSVTKDASASEKLVDGDETQRSPHTDSLQVTLSRAKDPTMNAQGFINGAVSLLGRLCRYRRSRAPSSSAGGSIRPRSSCGASARALRGSGGGGTADAAQVAQARRGRAAADVELGREKQDEAAESLHPLDVDSGAAASTEGAASSCRLPEG
jgi:hypothetical protein